MLYRIVLSLLAAAAVPGIAQVTTATLSGLVTDRSAAVIPGAGVTLIHENTGATVSKSTDAAGEFVFDFLRVGRYTLRIEAPGFKVFSARAVELAAAQNVRRTFVLEIGDVTETVNVEGSAILVNTVASEQRESFSQVEVSQLPLARRNFTNILQVGTGVTTSSGGGVRLNGLGRSGVKITVDGTDASSVPGVPTISMYQGFNYIDTMSIEAIQEVQTIKGVIAAEYGQALSGNVNLISKSGTNQWHGSLFENFQAENLNARSQFLSSKPGVTFNQFGGSIGGPVRRDRIFILGVSEGYRERTFRPVNGNVPTRELREQMIAAVPSYRLFLDSLPLPNQPYAPGAATGFYQSAGTQRSTDNHAVIKGDIRTGSAGNLALTYTRGRPERLLPRISTLNSRTWVGRQDRGTASFTTAHGRWTAETRFGYNLNEVDRIDGFFNVSDPARQEDRIGDRRVPEVSALGFSNAGEINLRGGPVWTIEQKIGRIAGRHSLKFGGIYSYRSNNSLSIENPQLRYDSVADLLANTPSRVQITFGRGPVGMRTYEFGLFVQDDWRMSPNLVVNLGVRHDFFSNFVARPTSDTPAGLHNLDGLLDDKFNFGPFRDPQNPYESDGWANFAPRIGFSYNPDGQSRNVLRGGFGVMFSPLTLDNQGNSVGGTRTLPFRSIFTRRQAIDLGLRFPVYNEDVRDLVESLGEQQVFAVFDPHIQAPYSMNLYLGYQRALTSSLMLESAFVGNRGVKYTMLRVFNEPDRVTGERPNPTLGIGNYYDASENTVYYSWQTSFRKRYSRGLTGALHYTWGRALSYSGGDIGASFTGDKNNSIQDFFNWRANRGPSAGDLTHSFSADFVYEIPRPGRIGGAAGAHLFGGWQLSGIVRASTGEPFHITQPSGIGASRPDYIGGEPWHGNYRETLQYLNRAAFARVPVSPVSRATLRPGNVGNNSLRLPGSWNLDCSVGKNFSLGERIRLQFRADMFNFFNHTVFTGVSTDITAANFGRLTSTAGARQIQLNARLTF